MWKRQKNQSQVISKQHKTYLDDGEYGLYFSQQLQWNNSNTY